MSGEARMATHQTGLLYRAFPPRSLRRCASESQSSLYPPHCDHRGMPEPYAQSKKKPGNAGLSFFRECPADAGD
jgi:hypothetical protein